MKDVKDVKNCRGLPKVSYSFQLDIQFPNILDWLDGRVLIKEGEDLVPVHNLGKLFDIESEQRKSNNWQFGLSYLNFITGIHKFTNKDATEFYKRVCQENEVYMSEDLEYEKDKKLAESEVQQSSLSFYFFILVSICYHIG